MKRIREVIFALSAIITGCALPPAPSGYKSTSGLSLTSESCLPSAKPLVNRPPIYPRKAIRQGITGWVVVEFDVSADGLPSNVHVLAASPTAIFDREAVDSVQQWRFEPGPGREKCREEFTFALESM